MSMILVTELHLLNLPEYYAFLDDLFHGDEDDDVDVVN